MDPLIASIEEYTTGDWHGFKITSTEGKVLVDIAESKASRPICALDPTSWIGRPFSGAGWALPKEVKRICSEKGVIYDEEYSKYAAVVVISYIDGQYPDFVDNILRDWFIVEHCHDGYSPCQIRLITEDGQEDIREL